MADLLIKPEAGSGNKLILQDQAGNAVLQTADLGGSLHNSLIPEGTDLKSTGESGGTKFLREDGDGTSSWQSVFDGDAGNLTGTVADARISTLTASKLTGALPAISGASLTNLPAGGTSPNYTDDGFKYITSNTKDYSASSGQSQFNWANVADFDMQLHKGSNVSESAGYYTLATAGVYAFSLLLLDNGYQYATHCYLFHNDVSAGTNIAHEPLVPAATSGVGGNYAASGSCTWFVDIEANDIVHIRCRGYMNGNWCGSGSPSCMFHGVRLG